MLTTIKASAKDRKSAKTPHELFTINMVIVHLFFSLGMVKLLDLKKDEAIAIAISISLCIILYTFFKTKKVKEKSPRLVYLHWKLSLDRYKLVIGAYVFSFIVTSLSFFIDADAPVSMDGTNIWGEIFSFLGIVPLFFVVLVSMVLGSGSMFNAGRGEIDQAFMQKHPQ
jgi:hypothetical protein